MYKHKASETFANELIKMGMDSADAEIHAKKYDGELDLVAKAKKALDESGAEKVKEAESVDPKNNAKAEKMGEDKGAKDNDDMEGKEKDKEKMALCRRHP
jgi:hypothetical protein